VLKANTDSGIILLSTKTLEREPGDMVNNRQAVFDNAEETVALLQKREDTRSRIKVCEARETTIIILSVKVCEARIKQD
jgi:hypothetical protein